MGEKTNEIIYGYISDMKNVLSGLPVNDIEKAVRILAAARNYGKRIYIFGNGGSAATASHMVCDLNKGGIRPDKTRLRAYSLTDNTPAFTAWGNDSTYEDTFAEQLENYIEPGDVAIAISGSGNSPNIVKGIKTARSKGAITIGFTGFDGGQLKGMVDLPVIVAAGCIEQVEDAHLILDHIVRMCLAKAADL